MVLNICNWGAFVGLGVGLGAAITAHLNFPRLGMHESEADMQERRWFPVLYPYPYLLRNIEYTT